MIAVTIRQDRQLIPLDGKGETFREMVVVSAQATDGETHYVSELIVGEDEPRPELVHLCEQLAERNARSGLRDALLDTVP